MNENLAAVIRNPGGISFRDESNLLSRIVDLAEQFVELYGSRPDICVRSPGRAEILGNHTDYNNGYALACPISRSIICLLRKRPDRKVCMFSRNFSSSPETFDLDNLSCDPKGVWTSYGRGVIKELLDAGAQIGGADIACSTNLPSSGGLSSSAAIELGLAKGLTSLYDVSIPPIELALICRNAENGPFVGAPCGFLDQSTIALGESGKMVFLDFMPRNNLPIFAETVQADVASKGYSFVISVDNEVKRNLGETGYPARRHMCEKSLFHLSQFLNRRLSSLRELSIEDFETCKDKLETTGGKTMRMRVEHVVYENERVLCGVRALKEGDVRSFGSLLTESGHSALELYGLDEKTPELTFLIQIQRDFDGIVGTRNMGGGFSAISLSLVKREGVKDFMSAIGREYENRWSRKLEFIEFSSTQGVEVL